MNDHPDPTGPDEPDEPTAARDGLRAVPDGNGNGGGSIAEAAANDEELEPAEAPLEAPRQLSLSGMGFEGRRPAIETYVSVMNGGRDSRGLFKPDQEVLLVVRGMPDHNTESYVREDGHTKTLKVTQAIRPLSIGTVRERSSAILAELTDEFQGEPRVLEALEGLGDALAVVAERQEVAV